VKIDCGGFLPKEVYSTLRPSFMLGLAMRVGDSLGRVWQTQASPKNGFFCLVSSSRKNSDLG
jgi:hypothetical protein